MRSSVQNSGLKKIVTGWRDLVPMLLVLVFLGAIYQVRSSQTATKVLFRTSLGNEATMDLRSFEQPELLNVKTGETEHLSFSQSDHTLLVLLTAGDCPKSLVERDVWAELVSQYPAKHFRIIGVLSRSSASEAETFTRGFDLPFTVYLDQNNELRDHTALPDATPFRVLLNGTNVVFADGAKITSDSKTVLSKRIREILDANS